MHGSYCTRGISDFDLKQWMCAEPGSDGNAIMAKDKKHKIKENGIQTSKYEIKGSDESLLDGKSLKLKVTSLSKSVVTIMKSTQYSDSKDYIKYEVNKSNIIGAFEYTMTSQEQLAGMSFLVLLEMYENESNVEFEVWTEIDKN